MPDVLGTPSLGPLMGPQVGGGGGGGCDTAAAAGFGWGPDDGFIPAAGGRTGGLGWDGAAGGVDGGAAALKHLRRMGASFLTGATTLKKKIGMSIGGGGGKG